MDKICGLNEKMNTMLMEYNFIKENFFYKIIWFIKMLKSDKK